MYFLISPSQALFGMCGAWLICFLLTVFDTLPSKPDEYGYTARTDINLQAVSTAPWFQFPYPGERQNTTLVVICSASYLCLI